MPSRRAVLVLAFLATTLAALPAATAEAVTVDLVATDEPRRAFYAHGEANPALTFRSGDEVTVRVHFEEGRHNFRVMSPIDAVTPTRESGTESLSFTIPPDFTGTIAYVCDYHADRMRGRIVVEGSEGTGGTDGNVTRDDASGDGNATADANDSTDDAVTDEDARATDGTGSDTDLPQGESAAGGADTPGGSVLAVLGAAVAGAVARGRSRARER